MTREQAEAAIAGVRRWGRHEDAMYRTEKGEWLWRDDVLAALEALPSGKDQDSNGAVMHDIREWLYGRYGETCTFFDDAVKHACLLLEEKAKKAEAELKEAQEYGKAMARDSQALNTQLKDMTASMVDWRGKALRAAAELAGLRARLQGSQDALKKTMAELTVWRSMEDTKLATVKALTAELASVPSREREAYMAGWYRGGTREEATNDSLRRYPDPAGEDDYQQHTDMPAPVVQCDGIDDQVEINEMTKRMEENPTMASAAVKPAPVPSGGEDSSATSSVHSDKDQYLLRCIHGCIKRNCPDCNKPALEVAFPAQVVSRETLDAALAKPAIEDRSSEISFTDDECEHKWKETYEGNRICIRCYRIETRMDKPEEDIVRMFDGEWTREQYDDLRTLAGRITKPLEDDAEVQLGMINSLDLKRDALEARVQGIQRQIDSINTDWVAIEVRVAKLEEAHDGLCDHLQKRLGNIVMEEGSDGK